MILTETTTKANAAMAGGAGGGAGGPALANLLVYFVWGTAVPAGIEASLSVVFTLVLAGVGARLATYYAPPNRPLPPP